MPIRGSSVRAMLAAATALALMVPLLPGLSVLEPARAQRTPSEETPDAVWRVRAQSWLESWDDDDEDPADTDRRFADVEFVAALHGYALARFSTVVIGEAQSVLLETTDGGDTWTKVFEDVDLPITGGLEFLDPDGALGFAYGEDLDRGLKGVMRTEDGGRSWSHVLDLEFENERIVNDFGFTSPSGSGVVGVGESGLVVRSTDGGDSWDDPVPDSSTESNLNAVSFLRDGSENAIGVAVGNGGTIRRTTDGGATWSSVEILSGDLGSNGVDEIPIDAVDLHDVAIVRDSAAGSGNGDATLAVAVGDRGTVLVSDDEGATWRRFLSLPGEADSSQLPLLKGVVLGDSAGDDGGGLVGYAVGSAPGPPNPPLLGEEFDAPVDRPLVLEMQTQDGAEWEPAPVDPRYAAFVDPSLNGISKSYQLQAVDVINPTNRTAMAVGPRLMLERTPLSEDPDPSDLNPITEDRWWQCIPPSAMGNRTGEEEIDEQLDATEDSVPEERVCRQRGETSEEASGGVDNIGPTEAEACQLDQGGGPSEQFPCLASWQPMKEIGQRAQLEGNGAYFFDGDLGGERRVVIHDKGRVYLFDPDRLEQEGVDGFGGFRDDEKRQSSPATFHGSSKFGFDTGVVNLKDAPEGFPHDAGFGLGAERAAYDAAGDRLYLGEDPNSFEGESPTIAALSLTGDFPPTAIEVPALLDQNEPGRTNNRLMALAADSEFGMLYALTESNPRRDVFTTPRASESPHVTLHAYSVTEDGGGQLSLGRTWSLPLEDRGCRSTLDLHTLVVDGDGDSLAVPCDGHAGPQYGNPALEPNKILTISLAVGDRHPRDLSTTPGSSDIEVSVESIGGKVFFEEQVAPTAPARNVLAWNQTNQGASLWDFDIGGWIGVIPFRHIGGLAGFGLDDEHPRRGRLYVPCGEVTGSTSEGCIDFTPDDDSDSLEPGMLVVDTLNVPNQIPAGVTETVRLPEGFPAAPSDRFVEQPLVAVPPLEEGGSPRLLFGKSGEGFHIFEDRVKPVGETTSPDPDSGNHPEVAEADAASVKRIGRARGFGARMWWTGLGTATALSCKQGHTSLSFTDPCGTRTLSYNWLTDRDSRTGPPSGVVPFGQHTSAVPGLPGGGTRELRLGEVQQAELENNKSGKRSQAKATAFFYGGGPADDSNGTTGEDVGRRRGRDPHRFADSRIDWVTGGSGAEERDGGEWEGTEAELCSRAEQNDGDDRPSDPDDPDFDEPDDEDEENPDQEQQCRDYHQDFRHGHEGSPPDDPDDPNEFCDRFSDEDGAENQSDEGFNPERECRKGFDGQFGPYEASFAELVDRGMREIDGDRKEQGGCANEKPFWAQSQEDGDGDCWERFDRNDPRCGSDKPETEDVDESRCDVDEEGEHTEDERSSVEERVELTYPSECLQPAGTDDDSAGSRADCEVAEYGHTDARAELNGFDLAPDQAKDNMPEQASGALDHFSIGASGSDTRIFRDDPDVDEGALDDPEVDEGIVAESTAWASDVTLSMPDAGSLSIGEVRSTAWARARGVGEETAASSVDVAFQDVVITSPDGQERFSCGRSDSEGVPSEDDLPEPSIPPDDEGSRQECDPHRVVDVISRAFGGKVKATTSARDSDPEIRGSDGGTRAILRRDPVDVLSDQVINRYTMWELPALELTVYNDGLRSNRLKIDLAAVYAEGTYKIGRERVEVPDPVPEPGTVQVELTDTSGAPLAGGGFAVHDDTDGDGQLGGSEPLVGECTTGGSGTCQVGGLDAGSYVVAQRFAPEGYRAAQQTAGAYAPAGATGTVTFTNAPDSAGVEVLLVDPSGRPLPGGQFGLVADAGQDGTVDPTDSVLGTCVTGDSGTCTFSGVPLGVYVLHQAAAPQGFETADDVPFALRSPGQVARIKVVNGTGVASAQVEIIEIIHSTPTSTGSGGGDGFGLARLAQLPKVFADILLRDPIQALLFGLTAGLFGAPLYLAVRRRELSQVRQGR